MTLNNTEDFGMCENTGGAAHKRSALILTLGCRVNHYESEAIAEQLRRTGFRVSLSEESGSGYDTVIVNTCSVTAMSDRKSRQIVHRALKNNPSAAFYITGCSAQNYPEVYKKIPGVRAVIGNRSKLETAVLAAVGSTAREPIGTDLSDAPFEQMSVSSFGRLRSYIKIEDGCRSNCAYCIIPSLRGDIRCKAPGDVIAEAESLVHGGSPEIVLTGIELSAYSYGLSELITRLDTIDGIRRIRLGSLDPSFMRVDFVDAYAACKHTMPHFHISMQSGCDRTLSMMRRRYNTAQVLEKLSYMRKRMPSLRLSADIICGFPGETDEDFGRTRDFLSEADFFHLHIFPYSKREGTEAAEMPDQVPSDIAKERVSVLMRDNSERQRKTVSDLAASCTTVNLLAERVSQTDSGIVLAGHTEEFFEASAGLTERETDALLAHIHPREGQSADDPRRLRGCELTARITGLIGNTVTTELI